MIELRLPKIDAPTEQGKINQIQDYLFQIIRQINLNFANKNSNDEGAEGKGDTYNYVVKRTTNITNVEDDDEEVVVPSVTKTGTWTPKVKPGSGTYDKVADYDATYTKVGNLVFVHMDGFFVPSASPPAEAFEIYGLPFKVKGRGFGEISTWLKFFTDSSKSTPCTNVSVELLTSGEDNCIRFKGWNGGSNWHTVKYNEVALSNGETGSGAISISAVYQTEE
jgi:hypothetical protein